MSPVNVLREEVGKTELLLEESAKELLMLAELFLSGTWSPDTAETLRQMAYDMAGCGGRLSMAREMARPKR